MDRPMSKYMPLILPIAPYCYFKGMVFTPSFEFFPRHFSNETVVLFCYSLVLVAVYTQTVATQMRTFMRGYQ